MTEEKQKLLKEIAFLSGLIDNHKKQKPKIDKIPTRKQNDEVEKKRATNFLANIGGYKPVSSKYTFVKVNSKPISKNEPTNRLVIPTASMMKLKQNSNRLVLKSSIPQTHSKLSTECDISRSSLSPIMKVNTDLNPQKTERTVVTGNPMKTSRNLQSVKTVTSSNQKSPGRIVLKPTRYKWTSKPKSSESSIRSPTKLVKNVPETCQTPLKKLSQPGNSAFKLSLISPGVGKKNEKLNKTIRTKYKLIRGRTLTPKVFRDRHKIINAVTHRISPKFIRRVRKYSIKYVAKERKTTPKGIVRNYLIQKSVDKKNIYKFLKTNKTPRKFFKIDKTGRFFNSSGKFVIIGGMLYKSSRNKLSKTNESAKSEGTKKNGSQSSKIITVRGVKFVLDSAGKTLKRMESNGAAKSHNLSRVDIGGETFIQTQPGLLVRSQATTKRSLASRSVNRSINRLVAAKKKSSQFCLFYNRFGKCSKKELGTCPFIHDPDKIAVCTRFLQGKCSVENCPFSHKICTSKMPSCTFFLRGRCSAETCPYRHVNVNPKAEICLDFVNGYCSLEDKCKKHHVFACPEFTQTGQCAKKEKCPLKHIVKQNKNKLFKSERDAAKTDDKTCNIKEDSDSRTADTSTGKLPSFIKLLDDSDLPENEGSFTTAGPLVIRPHFSS